MFGLPRPASLLWLLVTTSAALALSVCLGAVAADPRLALAAVLFVAAGAIADSFQVKLPTTRPGHHFTYGVGVAVQIAAVLVLPLAWAVLVVGSIGLLASSRVWFKRVFNGAQVSLAALAAAAVWRVAGAGAASLTDVHSVPAVVAVCLAYFAINTLLVAAIVGFATGLPVRLTWLRAHRHTWPAALSLLFVGALIAILWSTSAWTIALAAIPLTGLHYALRNTVSLETNTMGALFQLADILDARDPYTHGHSLRVGEYAEKLALALGLSGDNAHVVFLAGRLHDIGKCAIRNEVLLKPGALDDDERRHMAIHPEVGSAMLASFDLFKECARYVRAHHERWDGNGYPDGLRAEAIPIGARIIAVADAFDAMTTTRPYRKALPVAEAQRRLAAGAGSQWDPEVVSAFLRMLDSGAITAPTAEPVALRPAVALDRAA